VEGKRCRVICGDRISWGSGETRRVGRLSWRIRRAGVEISQAFGGLGEESWQERTLSELKGSLIGGLAGRGVRGVGERIRERWSGREGRKADVRTDLGEVAAGGEEGGND
jgi:hypothetical protein